MVGVGLLGGAAVVWFYDRWAAVGRWRHVDAAQGRRPGSTSPRSRRSRRRWRRAPACPRSSAPPRARSTRASCSSTAPGQILAVAAKSPADERSLMARRRRRRGRSSCGSPTARVGKLRMRVGDGARRWSSASSRRSSRQRGRARPRSRARLARGRRRLPARPARPRLRRPRRAARPRGGARASSSTGGASIVVARAHAHVATEDGWRSRVLMIAERGARAAAPGRGRVAARARRRRRRRGRRARARPATRSRPSAPPTRSSASSTAALPGHTFAVGRSRVADRPAAARPRGQRGAARRERRRGRRRARRCSRSRRPAPTACCCRR